MPITTIVKSTSNLVLFNDGEDAVYGDFNDIGNFERATLLDNGLGELARISNLLPSGPDSGYVYSMPGGAHALSSGTALSVTNAAGVLLMREAGTTIDGLTPRVHTVRIAADDLLTTLVPDPTNPMVYGIFLALSRVPADLQTRDFTDLSGVKSSQSMNKKTRIQISKNVVAGTPAASPTLPATPAGYAPWCYVYLTAAETGVIPASALYDVRVPVGMRSYGVSPKLLQDSSGAATPTTWGAVLPSGYVGYLPVPIHSPSARILGMQVYAAAGLALSLIAIPDGNTVASATVSLGLITGDAAVLDLTQSAWILPGSLNSAPFWCNGQNSPGGSSPGVWYLQLSSPGTARNLYGNVRFDIAG